MFSYIFPMYLTPWSNQSPVSQHGPYGNRVVTGAQEGEGPRGGSEGSDDTHPLVGGKCYTFPI